MTSLTKLTQETDNSRISREEMIELFGEEMPIEAVNLVWNSDGSKTCGELRAELRCIAKARPTQETEDVVGRFPITAAAIRRLRFAFWDYVEVVARSKKARASLRTTHRDTDVGR